MEQGCPHRSILPHIFPDCNSLAIKIGGKFCGVRGVPRWGACLGVAGAAGVRRASAVPGGGACLLCRLLTLPLAYFFAPIPQPPSRREGGDYRLFFARGCAPCIPGAEPGRHWFAPPLWKTQWGACPGVAGSAGVSGTRRGACLLCRLPALPLDFFSAPYPPAPLPRWGRGRFFVFLCKGLRPLHPRG